MLELTQNQLDLILDLVTDKIFMEYNILEVEKGTDEDDYVSELEEIKLRILETKLV
jgi:hypothetical protein